MSLFDRVRREIPSGTIFHTPVKRCQFRIDYENDQVVFFKDTKEKPFSKTPKICWDGIPEFLNNKGWVKIGEVFGVPEEGTFQYYIDKFHPQGKTSSTEAGHIASVLEHLGIVEVDPHRPFARVKLLP